MNSWFQSIDIYCERVDPSFWAEPVNALSNASFVIVGIYFLLKFRGLPKISNWPRFLAINSIAVGIGSFLFHTFANRWSLWADILPIMLFMCVSFLYILRYIFKFSRSVTGIFLVLFFTVGFLLEVVVPPLLNGSLVYSHAFVALLVVSFALKKSDPKVSQWFLWASIIFFISLTFRTLDIMICSKFSLGTHFMWHALNGLLLLSVIQGIATFEKSQAPGPQSGLTA